MDFEILKQTRKLKKAFHRGNRSPNFSNKEAKASNNPYGQRHTCRRYAAGERAPKDKGTRPVNTKKHGGKNFLTSCVSCCILTLTSWYERTEQLLSVWIVDKSYWKAVSNRKMAWGTQKCVVYSAQGVVYAR